MGSLGDSYDNALPESFEVHYRTELVRKEGPWRGLDDPESATFEHLDWFNQRRLCVEVGMTPPAKSGTLDYEEETPSSRAVSR